MSCNISGISLLQTQRFNSYVIKRNTMYINKVFICRVKFLDKNRFECFNVKTCKYGISNGDVLNLKELIIVTVK